MFQRNHLLSDLNQLDAVKYPIQTYGIVGNTTMRRSGTGGLSWGWDRQHGTG